ncbi:MAG: putative acetyltransferase protein [Verrucomicrobiales bacterium]|nr:putative acetyltransferase protein [Verrucomicrobiales bacterium]
MEKVDCQVRDPRPKQKYLFIGVNSVISGTFVFENSSGKVTIGDNSFIGGGLFVCVDRIEIGNDVMVSWGCTMIDTNAHSVYWDERKNDVRDWKRGLDEGVAGRYKNWTNVKSSKIVVKDKAWIGFNTIILKGVTIGEGAVVGAGSVVTKDVPAYSLAAGNPARAVRRLS